jgi:hypothetical protein
VTAQELDNFLKRYDILNWELAKMLDPPVGERQIGHWRHGTKPIPALRSAQLDRLKKEVEAGRNPFTDISLDTPITGKGLAIGGGIFAAVVIGLFVLVTKGG